MASGERPALGKGAYGHPLPQSKLNNFLGRILLRAAGVNPEIRVFLDLPEPFTVFHRPNNTTMPGLQPQCCSMKLPEDSNPWVPCSLATSARGNSALPSLPRLY